MKITSQTDTGETKTLHTEDIVGRELYGAETVSAALDGTLPPPVPATREAPQPPAGDNA